MSIVFEAVAILSTMYPVAGSMVMLQWAGQDGDGLGGEV